MITNEIPNFIWHSGKEKIKEFKPNQRYLIIYKNYKGEYFYILSFRCKRKEEWTKGGIHYLTEWVDWREPLIQNENAFKKHPYNTVEYWTELPDIAY